MLFILLKPAFIFSQDTTKVLFVGNSFTYFNNLPQLVKALADSAKKPMTFAMHAPGGISVGDISQGNQAHMHNLALYALIRSKKWDVMVLQDNQGRFVRDSAQFPPTTASKVVEGHVRLMDSLKANNSCAKMVLFAGWAFKNGSPPYGNTGIEMIKRLLCNYVVLNDSMKEVVSPIGEAWIKAINYLPLLDLWDPDQAHPSLAGSYLSASVIFSTIFNAPAKNLNHAGGIAPLTAGTLRLFADSVVFSQTLRKKYNQEGIKIPAIIMQNGELTVTGSYNSYIWYKNGQVVATTPNLPLSGIAEYSARVSQADGSILKTCVYQNLVSGWADVEAGNYPVLFPNPSTNGRFTLQLNETLVLKNTLISAVGGQSYPLHLTRGENGRYDSQVELEAGCYTITLETSNGLFRQKLLVN